MTGQGIKRWVLAQFVLAALLLVALLVWRGTSAVEGHLAGVACSSCHLTQDSGAVDPEMAKLLMSAQEKICESCHAGATLASHPSGFIPSAQLGEVFPLDWKGEMTCSTCHDVHGQARGLLRVAEAGKKFCEACHNPEFFLNMRDRGQSLVNSGHLDTRLEEMQAGDLDPYSRACIECHRKQSDQLGAEPVTLGGGGVVKHDSSRFSHPVGRSYEAAASYGGYRPASRLPSIVPLPGGVVSCISCHEVYSDQHGNLVSSNQGSKLCFMCHDI
ncbi:cytochrome c3 family protein [Aestuariirhabdus sp. LZHN29]|uniref:cytochrome c3 family protein n=1 Tax=Aestuariirhabdus sp. LZHN29 TaxID=3417462 RepID=UPI003CF0B48E